MPTPRASSSASKCWRVLTEALGANHILQGSVYRMHGKFKCPSSRSLEDEKCQQDDLMRGHVILLGAKLRFLVHVQTIAQTVQPLLSRSRLQLKELDAHAIASDSFQVLSRD